MLLAQIQLFIRQDLQVLFSRAAPQPIKPQPVSLQGLFPHRYRTLQLSLLNFKRFLSAHSSSLPRSLKNSLALKNIKWSPQLCVTWKFGRVHTVNSSSYSKSLACCLKQYVTTQYWIYCYLQKNTFIFSIINTFVPHEIINTDTAFLWLD